MIQVVKMALLCLLRDAPESEITADGQAAAQELGFNFSSQELTAYLAEGRQKGWFSKFADQSIAEVVKAFLKE
jgi:hypothetical protein